jgi:hypothetical protein
MRDALDVVAAGGLLLAMGGCSVFTAVKPTASSASSAFDGPSLIPASVAWPLSLGGAALIGAGIFVWIALGNRRRALLMIAAGVAVAVLPPIASRVLNYLVWPFVVMASIAGAGLLAYYGRRLWQRWRAG